MVNFKSYEAQSRLLTAVIASMPGVRLNFKDIAKYFGESTPGGIEFQFRAIKKDAQTLRETVGKGQSPLTACLTASGGGARSKRKAVAIGGGVAPPAKRAAVAATGTVTAAASTAPLTASTTPSTTATVRRRHPSMAAVFSNEEDGLDSEEQDYEQLDLTPVSTPTTRRRVLLPETDENNLNSSGNKHAAPVPVPIHLDSPLLATPTSAHRQPQLPTPSTSHEQRFYTPMESRVFDDDGDGNGEDDNDDDDGVFATMVGTPSKPPKMESFEQPLPIACSIAAPGLPLISTPAPAPAPVAHPISVPTTSFADNNESWMINVGESANSIYGGGEYDNDHYTTGTGTGTGITTTTTTMDASFGLETAASWSQTSLYGGRSGIVVSGALYDEDDAV